MGTPPTLRSTSVATPCGWLLSVRASPRLIAPTERRHLMQLKIKPVAGLMVLDPRTLGGMRRFHGFERGEPRERMVQGRLTLVPSFAFKGGEELVTETRDGFYRKAILSGDLDYVSHADGSREVALVAATARNRKAREAAALAAEHAAADAELAHELALEAAERGEEIA